MKHLFIVNPTAGGKDHTQEVRTRVEAAFRGRNESCEIYVTRAPMDAARKVAEAAEQEEHLRVYACGGDGTFNECVCGAANRPNVAVCPFPTGTGNDFCRMFGEEKDLYRDLDALLDGSETPIDLIECNGRYSANICSVGIDARIGTDVHKYSKLPLIGGAAGYVVSTLVNVLKGLSQKMRVISEGFDETSTYSMVCACNGRFYGGGFNPSLTARPDDGVMDVLVVKKVSLPAFATLIGKYASGRAGEIPQYISILHTNCVDIIFDEDNVVNVDGEAIYGKHIKMRLVRGAARLIVPAGMRFFDVEAQAQAAAV